MRPVSGFRFEEKPADGFAVLDVPDDHHPVLVDRAPNPRSMKLKP
jgi:hypothetical protein